MAGESPRLTIRYGDPRDPATQIVHADSVDIQIADSSGSRRITAWSDDTTDPDFEAIVGPDHIVSYSRE